MEDDKKHILSKSDNKTNEMFKLKDSHTKHLEKLYQKHNNATTKLESEKAHLEELNFN